MSATQELIAAALTACDVAATDYEGAYRAKRELREACARAMVQPDMAEVEVRPGMEGWKGAAIAWEVCASIHREYAKKKDPFFTTRQSDFAKHAEAARAKALAPAPDMAEKCDECDTVTARLDGDKSAKWCCYCGAKLTGNYVGASK